MLITGEVGVGKDLVAREIHRRSARSRVPLLEINCAALADDDELFDGDLPHEGTLFLNGIGELSPALQQQPFELLRCGEGSGNNPAEPLPTTGRRLGGDINRGRGRRGQLVPVVDLDERVGDIVQEGAHGKPGSRAQ